MRNLNFLFSNSVQGESDLTRYCPRDAFEMPLTCPRHLFCKMLILSMLLMVIGVGNVWGAYSATFTRINSLSELSDGDSILVVIQDGKTLTSGYAIRNNSTNNAAVTISTTGTPSIACTQADIVWKYVVNSGTPTTYTFQRGTQRIAWTSSTTLSAVATANTYTWTITALSGYTGYFRIKSTGTGTRDIAVDGSHVFKAYANGNYINQMSLATKVALAQYHGAISIYKKGSSCSSPATALSVGATETTIYAGATSTLSTTGGNGSTVTYSVTSDNSAYATISESTFSATRAGTYTVQASQDDNGGTCGGTSTVNITVRYQVKWSVNGDDTYSTGSPTTYIGTHNTKVTTLPTAPGSALCDGSKVFVGWTTGEYSHASTAPATLFTTASAAPNVTGNVTYYAVFANTGTSTASDVINRALVVGANSSIGSNNNSTWANATVTGSSSGAKYLIRSMGLNSATTYAIRWNSNGYLYTSTAPSSGYTLKSVTIQTLGSDKSVAIYGATSKYSAAATSTQLSSSFSATTSGSIYSLTSAQLANNYTCIGINGTESSTQIVSITITYNTTSYSNYATTCCTPLGTINGSVSWSNGTQATLNWDDIANVASWAVTAIDNTTSSAVAAGNITTPNDDGDTYSCVVSNLTAGHNYTFTIAATAASGYCDKSQEITATAPLITASGTIDGLNYAEGSGPSTAKSFTVSGIGLTGDITVTAPTNFEVSKSSGSGYGSSVSFSPTSGTLASSTVYVRLAAGKSVGTYGPSAITISGGGAANNTSVTVQGVVSVACHTPNITGQPASSTTYNLNATATALSVIAAKGDAGDPTLTYQWYSNTANSTTTPEPTAIPSATGSTYTPPTTSTGTVYYFCEVSSGICSTTSNIAAVTVNTPTITVSETARAFGERAINGSYTMTFTVSGSTLAKDAGISLALSGTNATLFSIDRTSLSATSNAVATTTITVTYSPNAVGSHSAQIDITSTGATTKTVALSGSVSNYTLTWNFTTGGSSSETAGTHYTAGGSVAHGAALTYPSDVSMSKNGYTFTGWSSDATTMPGNNLTITAQWEAKQYVVTLDANGGVDGATTSVTTTFGQAMPTISSVNLPTREGYRFDGFYTGKTDGTKYYNADGTSARDQGRWSDNQKLFAHWVAQLTFSVNGEVDDDLTRDDNTAMPSTAAVPTACGDCWTFMGWSTNSSESGAPAYAGGATHEFGEPTTLYAVFGKAEYEWISSTSGLVANDYYVLTNIVSSKEYAISNTAHPTYSNHASSTEVTDKIRENAAGYILYNPAANNIWKFTGTKDAGQLQNVGNTSLYLNLTGTGSILSTTDNLTFTLGDYGQWTIKSTKYLRHWSANGWDAVSTLTSGDFSCYLYHQTSAEYATEPSCETYDIVWKVNGTPLASGSQTEETNACSGIETMPDDPDDDELDCATKFVGWSESKLIGTGKSAPADLFMDAGDAPAIDEDKTFYAVFATTVGTPIDPVEDSDFSGLGEKDEEGSYCGMSYKLKTVGKYLRKQSIWTSSDMTNVKVRIRVYHVSNSTADVLRVSLIDSDGNEVVGADLSTNKYGTSSSSAGYSNYVELTPTSAVTGYKVSMKTSNSYGTGINKIEREVVASGLKDYMTSCCDELVELSTNSPSNGTITFDPVSPIATCDANQNVTMTITPNAGYKLSEWSVATGDGKVAASSTSPAVVTGEDNSDEQEIALVFNQHLSGTYAVSATFEQMHDEYYDYMHDNAKVGANRTGSYSAPSRTSKTAGKTANDCKGNHYKFKGWVVSTEINDDGTLKSGYTLITAGTSMTASNKIYYAVWAEEE